ncbi:hypothetical protein [Rhodococcus sp. WS3]|uniref:hypothetical protein n=1 Tax=Rhodococcus sp. WS3 TaxID=2486271 RepID=UPI0021C7C103|nr:hypothetical protein [Rhodococcus sp. WS3]
MTWSEWAENVGDPRLAVDPNVARQLTAACKALLGEFKDMKLRLSDMTDASGMGTLESGRALADKFSQKAVGGGDSLEKTLDSHIAVVKEMRAYFQACIDRYESVDDDNANRMARHEVSGS